MSPFVFLVVLDESDVQEVIAAGAGDAVEDLLDFSLAEDLRDVHRREADYPKVEDYPVRYEDVVRRAVTHAGDSIAGALSLQLAMTSVTGDAWAPGLEADAVTRRCDAAVRMLIGGLPTTEVARYLTE
jgi:hypothetical protein